MKNLFLLALMLLSFAGMQAQEFGVASYYADAFHGRKTASEEIYDANKMTAAHKELPFGTMIRVTRLDNNKSVVLRVNDRGPFISGRIVELSKVAAQKIGLIRDGIAEVKVEIVKEKAELAEKSAKKVTPKPENVPTSFENKEAKPVVIIPESVKVVRKEVEKTTPKAAPVKAKKPSPKPAAKKVTTKSSPKLIQSPTQDDLYKIQLIRPDKSGYGVQVAYLSDYENVFRQVADLQKEWFKNILISVKETGDETKYKIILGPFLDQETAEAYKASLLSKKKIKGFVVDLSEL